MPTSDSQFSLKQGVFQPLPLGSVKATGWLQRQLQLQAAGLTGHLDEFWPSVRDSRWIGGPAEGWERGPYWLDGLIPLAFLLGLQDLQTKAQYWVDYILAHQHEDGWLGAKEDSHVGEGSDKLDPWPLFVLFKAFLQWREATGDERIVPALLNCARRVQTLLTVEPLHSWARLRWADFVVSLHTLYELTGEEFLLELAATCQQQGYDWNSHFADLPVKTKTRHDQLGPEIALPIHGVNNAMGLKTGPAWWRQSGEASDLQSIEVALRELDRYHGAASGMFTADEHLAGLNPSQGFETCAVVEEMFSLEVAGAITGQATLFDRLEQVAYNALPAACSADMWSHQYHQQTNQVLCSEDRRDWTDAGNKANLFGQDVSFGCCQANLHQGWPKLAAHLWMKSGDGIAAVVYAPSTVEFQVGEARVSIAETTDYPFKETIRFEVSLDRPTSFSFALRIPGWAKTAKLELNGEVMPVEPSDGFVTIEREWKDGDSLWLSLPMDIRAQADFQDSLSLHRGSLVLSLPIAERWSAVGSPYADLEQRAQEWALAPQSEWNYALALSADATDSLIAHESAIGEQPFAAQNPPLSVAVPLRKIEGWEMLNFSAAPPPLSPVQTSAPIETLQLVPYGCARLRITAFPVASQGE